MIKSKLDSTITIRIRKEEAQEFRRYARENGTTMNLILRKCIRILLTEEEMLKKKKEEQEQEEEQEEDC